MKHVEEQEQSSQIDLQEPHLKIKVENVEEQESSPKVDL